VGARVSALRLARGLTQETLAERLDVAVRYVQRVEGGDENLGLDSLTKLANALGVRVAELFADAPARSPRAKPRRRP